MFSVSGSQSTSTGRRAEVDDDLGGRGEGHGRHDDLVAGPHADGLQREVQRRGGGIDGHGVSGADVLGEVFLEHPRLCARGDPTRAQRLLDGAHLFFTDMREMKRQKSASMAIRRCGSGCLRRFNFHDDEPMGTGNVMNRQCLVDRARWWTCPL